MQKQVERAHYGFSAYCHQRRWASFWHQIDEVLRFRPSSVLEIGPGPGVFKATLDRFVEKVETLDVDPELEPDHLAPADAMPFENGSFDVVCAFQMLEHVPYAVSLQIFREMHRVSRKGIVISLPDSAGALGFGWSLPWIGLGWIHLPRPRNPFRSNAFDGQHHWEVNKPGYSLKKVRSDLEAIAPENPMRTFRVGSYPYHRFFSFQKDDR